jgi:hypothetical protein
MKIMQTLEGGLRLDAEDASDWLLLTSITNDAVSGDENLARRLGRLITDPQVAPDWQDYVVPDLEDAFNADVQHVTTAIASARLESCGGPGPLWITPDDAMAWYSAFNQARLALEDCYRFGPSEKINLASLPPVNRSAFIRSQFYCAVQSLLLQHVMR